MLHKKKQGTENTETCRTTPYMVNSVVHWTGHHQTPVKTSGPSFDWKFRLFYITWNCQRPTKSINSQCKKKTLFSPKTPPLRRDTNVWCDEFEKPQLWKSAQQFPIFKFELRHTGLWLHMASYLASCYMNIKCIFGQQLCYTLDLLRPRCGVHRGLPNLWQTSGKLQQLSFKAHA